MGVDKAASGFKKAVSCWGLCKRFATEKDKQYMVRVRVLGVGLHWGRGCLHRTPECSEKYRKNGHLDVTRGQPWHLSCPAMVDKVSVKVSYDKDLRRLPGSTLTNY